MPLPSQISPIDCPAAVTIASGQSLSAAADLGGARLCGIILPATWTSASISFAVSSDGVTYFPLYTDGVVEYSIANAAAVSVAYGLNISILAPWRYVKVRSGLVGAATAQGGDRVITLVTRPV